MSTTKKVVRGDIFYVKSFPTVGCEQMSGRPAVIVSNNENNTYSKTFEVCYMTLKEKNKLPTHVFIDRGACVNSTILCEQITTISEDKLGDFMCHIPVHLEEALDKALAVSLGLSYNSLSDADSKEETLEATQQLSEDELFEEYSSVVNENTALKHDFESVRNELAVAKDANTTIKETLAATRSALDVANTKADMYERMYNDLLDRLIKRA